MSEPIFNSHAHIYPVKIAAKAVNAIGGFYDIPMELDGTPETLIKDGENSGCIRFAVCSVATTPAQVVSINDFILGECEKHPGFTGLGTLHPDYPDINGEIARLGSRIKGIKLHPDFQKFYIDSEQAFPIYAACEGRLPVLFHIGDDRTDYSSPERLKRVLDLFPGLIAVAAHFGGYRVWDRAECLIGHRRVYLDTSSSLMFISPELAADKIRRHGADRVLFGTDYPMWAHAGELKRFDALGLTCEERRMILWENSVSLWEKP